MKIVGDTISEIEDSDIQPDGSVLFPPEAQDARFIEELAAMQNPQIKTVDLPEKIVTIKTCAFYKCENLQSVNLKSPIKLIGEQAFGVCTNLKSVTIPCGVIGGGAFIDCKSLSDVILGDGVELIGGAAFRDCRSLKKLTIPKTVDTNKSDLNIKSLEEITFEDPNATFSQDVFNSNKPVAITFGNEKFITVGRLLVPALGRTYSVVVDDYIVMRGKTKKFTVYCGRVVPSMGSAQAFREAKGDVFFYSTSPYDIRNEVVSIGFSTLNEAVAEVKLSKDFL